MEFFVASVVNGLLYGMLLFMVSADRQRQGRVEYRLQDVGPKLSHCRELSRQLARCRSRHIALKGHCADRRSAIVQHASKTAARLCDLPFHSASSAPNNDAFKPAMSAFRNSLKTRRMSSMSITPGAPFCMELQTADS